MAHLTLQAQQILSTAEVLLYDALSDGELLTLVPRNCLTIDVGKRGGQPSMRQSEINQRLVEYYQQGYQVVRLKSGDPFIFGRSQSEIQALRSAGCAYEVVPGMSSALVAPLLAGIPLTDPVLSRGFTVLTAHDPEALDWETLSRMETLVILMGGQALPEIVRQLLAHDRAPQTPIAIIRWAGRSEQRVWEGILEHIVSQTTGETLSPCVIVVGEVVGLRHYLYSGSFSPSPSSSHSISNSTVSISPVPPPFPLSGQSSEQNSGQSSSGKTIAGKTVLVTRSATQSTQLRDRLVRDGAVVIDMPALEIVPPASWVELDAAIARLTEFDWLIFTSANAIDYFFERLATQLQGIRGLAAIKIAVVGEKTAQKLKERGLQPDFVPPEFIADSLAINFPGSLNGAKILFPRVESGGRELLVKDLTARGAIVTEVAAYQSRCPDAIAPEALEALQNGRVDIITFASSKTVKHFCQMLERCQPDVGWQTWLESLCIASIGPQTSKTCASLLGRVDAEAQEYTLEGLVQAIEQWLDQR